MIYLKKVKFLKENLLRVFMLLFQMLASMKSKCWNTILGEFPLYRLSFTNVSRKISSFLLSNTDAIHIDFENNTFSFTKDFYQCFERIYFSFEMGMRKPDSSIYNYVLKQNDLVAKNTLFIDDKRKYGCR